MIAPYFVLIPLTTAFLISLFARKNKNAAVFHLFWCTKPVAKFFTPPGIGRSPGQSVLFWIICLHIC